MDDAAAARIQIFRDKAAAERRVTATANSERAKELHQSAAQQWAQLADIAEGLERTFPVRPVNRAAERVTALRGEAPSAAR